MRMNVPLLLMHVLIRSFIKVDDDIFSYDAGSVQLL
jgi:hypothetical protein